MNTPAPNAPIANTPVAHRPTYHFMPPALWMNDPNGLIYHDGLYHVFYQHNPGEAVWGDMHWGHATSPDLLHWTHLPLALAPTPGGLDKDGCFSGCCVVDGDGTPTLVYTATQPETQCLATSRDGLQTWTKFAGNPVIAHGPDGLELTGFRDPHVWHEGGEWKMLLGAGLREAGRDVGGTCLLYRSRDLHTWEYRGLLCRGTSESSEADSDITANTGTVWECPDFFPLGGKWVLLVSPIPLGKVLYFVGTYADERFTPERQGMADFGDFYAAHSFLDAHGRRLLYGWVWEAWGDANQKAAGWAGALSLPRVLSLHEDNTLQCEPALELQALRHNPRHWSNPTADDFASLQSLYRGSTTLELQIEFAPTEAARYGLKLRTAPDGSEETILYYEAATQRLVLDRSRSSLEPATKHDEQSGPLALNPGEPLRLHLFMDNSLIEIYANNRACLTTRVYPTRSDSTGFALHSENGSAVVNSMNIWEMRGLTFTGA